MSSLGGPNAGADAPARGARARYRGLPPGAVSRAAGFLLLWVVLAGADPADLPAAALAVLAATWTSLQLLPSSAARPSPAALARLVFRFACQSAAAGADVAWRALDPRLPLRPGFVAYPVRLPPGTARNAFTALTSLLPGTVPTGDENGELLYHCLDADQPVAAQLAAEEAALSQALRDD